MCVRIVFIVYRVVAKVGLLSVRSKQLYYYFLALSYDFRKIRHGAFMEAKCHLYDAKHGI